MTENRPTIIELLAKVMEDVEEVKKDGYNNHQNYKFRGVDAVVNEVGPALRKHGVVPIPVKSSSAYRDVVTSGNKPSRECTVTVTYRFYGPAGDFVDAEVPGEAMDSQDKGTAKAMSVAYRILLLQVLCIPTGDDDPDAGAPTRATPRKQQRRADAAEVSTDPTWIDDMKGKVRSATSRGELNKLWSEVTRARDAGVCSNIVATSLQQEMAAAGEVLKASGPETAQRRSARTTVPVGGAS
jgi:hypothetical protein